MKQEIGQLQFGKKFSRTGGILRPDTSGMRFKYQVIDLSPGKTDSIYQIVRDAEDRIAPAFDDVQFASPGMRFLAETDTRFVQRELGNVQGKRLLDIGPGTGRLAIPMADAVGDSGRVYAMDISSAFIEALAAKATKAQISPDRLRLAVGDIQNISLEAFDRFLDSKPIDAITIWFSVLSLMTSKPQDVINLCAQKLSPGGALLVDTNSFDGAAFRVPEAAIRQGADPAFPLGYSPSIYSARSFKPGEIVTPSGMVLRNGDVMPAVFYRPQDLITLMLKAGLNVQKVRGITRLTGLYPRDTNEASLKRYIEIVSEIEPKAADQMLQNIDDPEAIFRVATKFDKSFSGNTKRLSQYNYIAVKAGKD